MTKHIHIYLPTKTRDEQQHAPAGSSKGGQFTSGSGGGGSSKKSQPQKASPAKKNNLLDRPDAKGKEPSDASMKNHAQYTKEDHDYLKGKGWTNSQIRQRWDAEKDKGNQPAKGKVKAPDYVGVISNPNFYKKK